MVNSESHLSICATGWRRPIRCLKLQVIFRKRATNYRTLLRKMTYTDNASYGSLPSCMFFTRATHRQEPKKYLNVLQCVAEGCTVLQSVAVCCSVLQCVAVCCSVSELTIYLLSPLALHQKKSHCTTHSKHTATHCNTLQHTATHCNTLQHTATHCNTLHNSL